MVLKQNCWEFKNCGREPGGAKVGELGICPAANITSVNGVHGGINGGRSCWAVVDTFCGGSVQDNLVLKLHNCVACEFRTIVEADEQDALWSPQEIIAKIERR